MIYNSRNRELSLSDFRRKKDNESIDFLLSEKSKTSEKFWSDEIPTERIKFNMIPYIKFRNYFKPEHTNVIETIMNFSIANLITGKDLLIVIDDHKLLRENTINLIKKVLISLNLTNFQILEGSDGIDLLKFVINDKENRIKYIFCDENMEYLNGSDAVRIIRDLESNNKICSYQIASITAFDDEMTKKRILKAGFNLVLDKPCTKSVISNLISSKCK
jgi:CheY-like chemotaxis protein